MILSFKTALIIILLCISYQDLKTRLVYWFLFLGVFTIGGFLHYYNVYDSVFWNTIFINLGLITIIVVFLALYSKVKLKINLFKAIGLGDILLFIAFSVAFPTVTFIILFVFSLLFALVLHLFLKKEKEASVPLAGYMSLFLVFVYLVHWLGFYESLYLI